MDPKVAFEDLLKALKICDWDEVSDCLDALTTWMRNGGFTDGLDFIERPKGGPMKVFGEVEVYNSLLGARREHA